MPTVQSPVCIPAIGLPLFAGPRYIWRCHGLLGQFFFISPTVDTAYVGHRFATSHRAMIHFLVPFVTGFRRCQPEIHISSFARDLAMTRAVVVFGICGDCNFRGGGGGGRTIHRVTYGIHYHTGGVVCLSLS